MEFIMEANIKAQNLRKRKRKIFYSIDTGALSTVYICMTFLRKKGKVEK